MFQENERMKENMKGDNMKVGIIGCGKLHRVRHIPEYLENPLIEILDIMTGMLTGQQNWQRNLAARHSTEDELLADKGDGCCQCLCGK